MIDWRAVSGFPALSSGTRTIRRGLRISLRLSARFAVPAGASPTAATVPWTWADAGRGALWTAGLAVGGGVGLILFRLLVSFFFAAAELIGVVQVGTFDRITGALQPYATAGMALLLGGMLYCAVFYGVYRSSIRMYTLPWSSLYFRHAGWRTYGLVAALFIPITLGGVLITRLESLVIGGSLHNSQGTILTHNMPALPLNFLFLFLLLAVITPIAEETLFRAFLYRLLRKRLPVWAAVCVSAAAFAVLHGTPALMPWLFFMGVVFALIVERTRSIYCSILLHGMTNALAALSMIVVLAGW